MKLRRAASKSFEDNGNGGSVENYGEQEVERSRLKDENVQQACSELMQVRPPCDMCRDNFELNWFIEWRLFLPSCIDYVRTNSESYFRPSHFSVL